MKYVRRGSFAVIAGSLVAVMLLGIPGVLDAKGRTIQVNVPFDFHAGKDVLQAGTYRVKQISSSVVQLIDMKGNHWAVLANEVSAKPTRSGELLFNRYDDAYFLSEVRWEGTTREPVKSPEEIELAKNINPKRVIRSAGSR